MNLKFKKTFLLVIILFIAFPNFVAYAQNDTYTLLAPIPCVGVGGGSCDQNATQTRMPDYIKGLVRLVIGISTVFAVLMIVIGGFQYMTSDALQGKQDGKNRIKNSFLGLLLIGASFIILNTINPNLLEINLNIESVQTASQTVGTGELSAGGTCTTCVPLDSSLPLKPNQGTEIFPDTNTKLVEMNKKLKDGGVSWWITEAYPPTVVHSNQCHSAGTCVDANFTGGSLPKTSAFEDLTPSEREAHAKNINAFIKAASDSGLRAIYEVPTEARKSLLVQAGVPSSQIQVVTKLINNKAIEPHFSVYN